MTDDVEQLHSHVQRTLGSSLIAWPGGWPGEIEAALIDAVFSVRAKYGSRERKTGVYGAVWRWRVIRGEPADDLRVLASANVEHLREVTNDWKIGQRHKAAIVIEAAGALAAAGVIHTKDFVSDQAAARKAYLSVKGCGPVTWSYLRMLLGIDDVKPDTWILKFVREGIPDKKFAPADASALISAVAARMDVDARQLDHAIWSYQRAVREN